MTLTYFVKVHNSIFCSSASYYEGTRFESLKTCHSDWGISWFPWIQAVWWEWPENTTTAFSHIFPLLSLHIITSEESFSQNIKPFALIYVFMWSIYENKNIYTFCWNSIFWAPSVSSLVCLLVCRLFFTFPHNWIIGKRLWFALSLYEL
jgi:hypothetical protein